MILQQESSKYWSFVTEQSLNIFHRRIRTPEADDFRRDVCVDPDRTERLHSSITQLFPPVKGLGGPKRVTSRAPPSICPSTGGLSEFENYSSVVSL